ncbi:hypothetical protein CKM354_000489100 [Cercospora kikuchii]|uniref:Uncharacterized protein n=1 Tax=Cercospora kikuchii TaxID=84275 RepID=A0A9P3CE67_9PEZI|nr:uncharacterized protein CKM354_000489100 [Cercospora kikuchii]GIZ41592.1 hypothetical protein CKM354_000489100 [Cercospora kikuchii]
MSATPFKTQASSSPEQGTPLATGTAVEHHTQPIEPPAGIARFMADRSDDEQDPMAMGHIGLHGGNWDEFNEEVDDTAQQSSPTPARVTDDQEEFEIIGDEELPNENDPAYVHDQHVRAMMNHRVPPYPIPSHHATPAGDREDQVRRYNLFIEECYPIDRWPIKRAMEEDLERAPRHGSPNRYLRIIHIKGETLEVHKDDWIPCDHTCPARKKTFLEQLTAASGKFLGLR